MNFAKPLVTVFVCAAAQICAAVVGHALWTRGVPFPAALLSACSAAIGMCLLCRSRTEITLLNALFPLAVVASFSGENFTLYSGWLLPFALFLLLLFIPTLYSGVPYYPTHRKVYDAVKNLLPRDTPFYFIDLGCGDGRMLAYLARCFPKAKFFGCELSPLAWLVATIRCLPYRSRVQISFSDLWRVDVSKADYIYNFLAPPVMARLWMKLSVESKPTALLISNAFEFPVKAEQTITFDSDRRSALYLYPMTRKN